MGENTCESSIPKNKKTRAFNVNTIVDHVLSEILASSAANKETRRLLCACATPATTAAMIPDTPTISAIK